MLLITIRRNLPVGLDPISLTLAASEILVKDVLMPAVPEF